MQGKAPLWIVHHARGLHGALLIDQSKEANMRVYRRMHLAALAREARAAQADGEIPVRKALLKWAGDDFARAKVPGDRQPSAKRVAKLRRVRR